MIRTLLDSGPLVAFFDRQDGRHVWAYEQMGFLQPPLLTCEPVLTEACFLLQRGTGHPAVVLQALQQGTLQVAFELAKEGAALQTLMRRYTDVPMSLADACLVRLSELHQDSRVFTLDKDFTRYRRHGRQIIPLLAPPWIN
jgi:predicted nucleic acid-binding protein